MKWSFRIFRIGIVESKSVCYPFDRIVSGNLRHLVHGKPNIRLKYLSETNSPIDILVALIFTREMWAVDGAKQEEEEGQHGASWMPFVD